mgnify:CR=1 FL=1
MAEEENNEAKAAGAKLASGQLAIQKVYVKDISFEAPDTPAAFKDKWEPQVNMELSNDSNKLEENLFDITLGVTITVKANDKTVYLVEVKQAGIFLIEGFPTEAIERIIGTACPNILFPFARELVAYLVTRGDFPQLLLSPVNFDALYMQHKLQQQNVSDTKH